MKSFEERALVLEERASFEERALVLEERALVLEERRAAAAKEEEKAKIASVVAWDGKEDEADEEKSASWEGKERSHAHSLLPALTLALKRNLMLPALLNLNPKTLPLIRKH